MMMGVSVDAADYADNTAWTVVVPVKPLWRAKTRLAPAVSPRDRARLAEAFALDTVDAIGRTRGVRRVVVVTDDPAVTVGADQLTAMVIADQPDAGLNPALAHAMAYAVERDAIEGLPPSLIAAVAGDLPGLLPAEFARVLEQASRYPRAVLADAAGTGTAGLFAAPGTSLESAFGRASLAAHIELGYVPLDLPDVDSCRSDVDTWEDLVAARSRPLGARTAAVLAGPLARRVTATVGDFDGESGWAASESGVRLGFSRTHIEDGIRLLRRGQNVAIHLDVNDAVVGVALPVPLRE